MNIEKEDEEVLIEQPKIDKAASNITYRELSTFDEYQDCVNIQRETWGDEFEELVPTAILKVSQKVGGIVAGAYDEPSRMIGFVYGLTGMKDGHPAHWSHMLAVRKEARGLGIGRQLKLYQRDLLLSRGVHVAYWTFDPLVAKNANLNLNSLGAVVSEYVKEMYLESGSALHRGMSMDRFIVAWHLTSDRVRTALARRSVFEVDPYAQSAIVNIRKDNDVSVIPADLDLPLHPRIRVEIPSDIEAVKAKSMPLASQWRANTRRVFLRYQECGYTIDGFYTDPTTHRNYYCLTSTAEVRR